MERVTGLPTVASSSVVSYGTEGKERDERRVGGRERERRRGEKGRQLAVRDGRCLLVALQSIGHLSALHRPNPPEPDVVTTWNKLD